MNPHPRIRKTVKWGGLAVTVVLVGVWDGSGWRWFEAQAANRVFAGVGGGYIVVGRASLQEDPSGTSHFIAGDSAFSLGLWYYREKSLEGGWVGIPLWMAVVASVCVSGLAWRLDALARRRATLNLCPTCRYSRSGLPLSGPCPECGSAAPGTRT